MKMKKKFDIISEILEDSLFVTGVTGASDTSRLQKNKIDVIITCVRLPSIVFEFCECHQYLIHDTPSTRIIDIFGRTNEIIKKSIDSGKRVMVNCHLGKSRSTTLVISYLMRHHFLKATSPFDQSYEFVRSKRPVTKPNNGFLHQLKEFEKRIKLIRPFFGTPSMEYIETTTLMDKGVFRNIVQFGIVPKVVLEAKHYCSNPNQIEFVPQREDPFMCTDEVGGSENQESGNQSDDSDGYSGIVSSSSSSENEEEENEEKTILEIIDDFTASGSEDIEQLKTTVLESIFKISKNSVVYEIKSDTGEDKKIEIPGRCNGILHSTEISETGIKGQLLSVHHSIQKNTRYGEDEEYYSVQEIGFVYLVIHEDLRKDSKILKPEAISHQGWNLFHKSKFCNFDSSFETEWNSFNNATRNPLIHSFYGGYILFLTPSLFTDTMKTSKKYDVLNISFSVTNEHKDFISILPCFNNLYEVRFCRPPSDEETIPMEGESGHGNKALLLAFCGTFNDVIYDLIVSQGFSDSVLGGVIDNYMNNVMKKTKDEEEEQEGEEQDENFESLIEVQPLSLIKLQVENRDLLREKFKKFVLGTNDSIDRLIEMIGAIGRILQEKKKKKSSNKNVKLPTEHMKQSLRNKKDAMNDILRVLDKTINEIVSFESEKISGLLDLHSKLVSTFCSFQEVYQTELTPFIKSCENFSKCYDFCNQFTDFFIDTNLSVSQLVGTFKMHFVSSKGMLVRGFPHLKRWIQRMGWVTFVKKLRKVFYSKRRYIAPRVVRLVRDEETAVVVKNKEGMERGYRGLISGGDSGGGICCIDEKNRIIYLLGIVKEMRMVRGKSRELMVDVTDSRFSEYLF